MTASEALTFANVSPDKADRLRSYLAANGGMGMEGNAGVAGNDCFSAEFEYDPDSGLLRLKPLKLVKSLTPNRLKQLVDQILEPRPLVTGHSLLTAGDIYKPTPTACAVYNWAIGFITNNTDGVLSYSTNQTDHGIFTNVVNRVTPGMQPSDQTSGFWQNQSPKDSVAGCSGSVTYTFADGVTTMTISYSVNTLSSTSANVGLAGQNAARYSATVDKQTQFYSAAAYVYPYVTVGFAT